MKDAKRPARTRHLPLTVRELARLAEVAGAKVSIALAPEDDPSSIQSDPLVKAIAKAKKAKEPKYITCQDGDGRLVTVIRRVPREGERGLAIPSDLRDLDEAMTYVLDFRVTPEGEYGWLAGPDERDCSAYWLVTIETHPEPEECALATVEDLRALPAPRRDPVPPEDIVGELRAYAEKNRTIHIAPYTLTRWADEIERALGRCNCAYCPYDNHDATAAKDGR